MEQRLIGSLRVSSVGLGCNNFGIRLDQACTDNVVHAALDHGITFFDTSNTYGETQSEVFLGRALGARRASISIASKFGMGLDERFPDIKWSAHPDYVASACEASLRRLGTDHIDLYQLHFPDAATPLEDTIAALQALVAAGKVREFGCSNFDATMLHTALVAARGQQPFRSVQNQYSLLARDPEDGVLAACGELGLGLLPYYPLANGMLTEKFVPGAPPAEGTRLAKLPENRRGHWLGEEMVDRASAVHTFARSINTPVLTLAFSWLLSHPQVSSVIAGASNAAQIEANVAAVEALSPEVIAELNRLTA